MSVPGDDIYPRHEECRGRFCLVLNCRESILAKRDDSQPVNLPATKSDLPHMV